MGTCVGGTGKPVLNLLVSHCRWRFACLGVSDRGSRRQPVALLFHPCRPTSRRGNQTVMFDPRCPDRDRLAGKGIRISTPGQFSKAMHPRANTLRLRSGIPKRSADNMDKVGWPWQDGDGLDRGPPVPSPSSQLPLFQLQEERSANQPGTPRQPEPLRRGQARMMAC